MTSTRAIQEGLRNVLDYLVESELALIANALVVESAGVGVSDASYQTVRSVVHDARADFLVSGDHPGIDQYLAWIRAGAYSAVLFDGSLLQMSYDVTIRGEVIGHRLAYMPCPYAIDTDLLRTESLLDVVDLYVGTEEVLLRSAVRFDFDPRAGRPGHPPAHMTINSSGCRIACVAPLHVLRFLDFVFRHFYPAQHRFHARFFDPAAWQHLGRSVLEVQDRLSPHLAWDVNARMSSAGQLLAG